MGLLDDAIREHLELKRRRGADAGDISREESEALGPVHRGPDGAPDLSDTFESATTGAEGPPDTPASEGEETAVLSATPPAPEPPSAHGDYEPPSALGEYEPPPAHGDYEPPSALREYEPPPAPGAYEPPPVPASLHESPPAAGGYEPPAPPAYEPPPTAYEVPARSHEPPTTAYEPPPPPPASPPEAERPWFESRRSADEPEPDPFAADDEPAVDDDPEPEPEPHSLLSRFRVGRKSKQSPPQPDEPASSFEPPPLPSSYDPASPYEPPPAASPPSYGDEPPAQHEPDIVPADDEPDVEDVLEETPDFLEETPEHDRLWFEQRPPRDFDFDDK